MKSLICLLLALASVTVVAQAPPPQIRIEMPSTKLRPQQLAVALVKITFAPGLHGYQNPPSEDYMIPVTVSAAEGMEVVAIDYPAGHGAKIGGSATEVMTYSGEVTIRVLFRVPKKAGASALSLNVMYQQCNDDSCFPPGNASLRGGITVAGTGPASLAWRFGNDAAMRAGGRS